jgi:hypothetical protein
VITLTQLQESTEFIQLQVVAQKLDGTPYNPTSDPVAIAFQPVTSPPGSPDPAPGAFNAATWTTDTAGNYWAGILVGPLNGGVSLAVGSYLVVVRVTDSPAVPVKPGAYLVVV